jgi:hypothetical protein
MTNIWAEAYKEVREPFFEMEDPYTNLSEEKKEKEEKEESEEAGEDQEHKYKKSGKKSKDYDKDGEVEDEADEYAGVKDKAIKKAMKEERELHSKKGKNEQIKEMPSGKRNKVEINPSIKEEVEEWVDYLISEGYDLSDFTWEELEEIYVTEARDGYGDDSKFNKPDDRIKRPGTDVPAPKKGGYGRITSVMPKQISGHATRTISANTRVRGEDPGAPKSQKIAKTTKLVKKDGKWVKNEEVVAWVEGLLEEGYDLSDFTWGELEEIYFSEDRDGYGDDSKFKQDTDAKSFKPGTTVPKVKKYNRISRAMPASISGHATRTISANTRVRGEDPGAPRSQKIAKTTKLVKKDGKWVKNEEVIAWVEDLIQEGYDFSELTWDEVFDLYEETMVNDSSSKRKAAQAQIRKELADVQLAKANAAAQKQTNESVIIYLENRYNL